MKIKIKLKKGKSDPQKKSADNTSKNNTLLYLLYFLIIVFASISIGCIFRLIFLFQNSTFKTSSYSIYVKSESPYIVSLDKTIRKISITEVPKSNSDKRLQLSLLYGVPIDGVVSPKSFIISQNNFPTLELFLSLILQPWQFGFENMTTIDMLKVMWAAYPVSQKERDFSKISLSKSQEIQGISQEELYAIFKDANIVNEQQSIEIQNATNKDGLAGKVALILENTGCSVVSITSKEEKASSQIVSSHPSVTLTRIAYLLGIKPVIKENGSGIADIQIILGNDFVKKVE